MNNQTRGLLLGIAGSLFFAIMGVALFYAHSLEPAYSSSFASFTRILTNSLILFLPLSFWGIAKETKQTIFSDGKPLLWLWGVLGAATLFSYYIGISRIGMSEASFLQSSQGIFTALFAGLITRQKPTLFSWVTVIGSATGITILYNPGVVAYGDLLGRFSALCSGLFAGLAYCVLALLHKENSRTISFYWCLLGFFAHIVFFIFEPIELPQKFFTIFLVAGAGFLASFGQVCITLAYQLSPAIQLAAISYITPVLSLLLEFIFFASTPGLPKILGATVIIFFGALLPLIYANFFYEDRSKVPLGNL